MPSFISSAFLNSDLTGAVKNAIPKLNIAGAATKVGMATSKINKVGDTVTQGLMSTPTGVTQIIGSTLMAGKMASDAINAGNTNPDGTIKDKGKFGIANALNPFSYLTGINNNDKFNKQNGEIRANKLMERLNSQQPIAKEAEQFSSYVKKGGKIKDPNRPKHMKSMYGGIALYKNGEFLKTNQKMNANTSGVTPKLMFFRNGGVPKFQTPAGPISRRPLNINQNTNPNNIGFNNNGPFLINPNE